MKAKLTNRIILGIDPGTNIMGYGIVEICEKTPLLLEMGIIDMRKEKNAYKSLRTIFSSTIALIDKFKPDELAIEAPFYGKNIQSMLKLGRAQGVAISAALSRDIPIFEYAPRKIKMSITGRGNASKEQVAAILQHLIHFREIPKNLDATDGVAAAVCHFFQSASVIQTKTGKSWKDFIKTHPERIKS